MFLPHFLLVPSKTWSIQSQLHPDLCPYSQDPRTWRIPSVFCSDFVLLLLILNLWWSVHWLHIQYDKCTRRNWPELVHCPVMKEINEIASWMTLESSEIKNFLSWWISTILIFSCCLRLLPSCSSIHHRTNIESTQIWFRISSFSLQNSIAPSSSRGRWPLRRRVLNCFDTG